MIAANCLVGHSRSRWSRKPVIISLPNQKQRNTRNKRLLTQRFNHELIQITAVLQPGVDHRQVDLSLLNDGHPESRISPELINRSKRFDVTGHVTPEVDNLIPVIKVAQRPATQIRKSIVAIRNIYYTYQQILPPSQIPSGMCAFRVSLFQHFLKTRRSVSFWSPWTTLI